MFTQVSAMSLACSPEAALIAAVLGDGVVPDLSPMFVLRTCSRSERSRASNASFVSATSVFLSSSEERA
jgi:hypothetical protein